MTVADIIEGIGQYIDLENLADYITDVMYQFFSSPISLLLWDQNKKGFFLHSQRGTKFQKNCIFEHESEIFQWLSANGSKVLVHDKVFNEGCLQKKKLQQELQNLNVEVCLALRSDKNEIVGLLNVGPKKNKQAYSDKELDALEHIAHQVALTIDKINIYTRMVGERVYANLGKIAIQIAHDLNSPLNNISVFFQLLAQSPGWKDAVSSDLSDKFFPIAQKEIKRATAIINNLLMYARPFRSKTEQVNVNQLLDQIVSEIFAETIKNKAIHIIQEYIADELIIPGEYEQLTRVFVNLIQNAIEAMEKAKKKELIIRTELEKQWAKIHIIDTGQGIADEIKENLFTPFASHGKENGIGLGLSIVERLITFHGGDIQVKINQDHGVSFIVSLPLEKRIWRRKSVASVEVYRIPQEELLLAQDISGTGLRVSSQKYIAYDYLFKLLINFPNNSSPILALGKVVWIKEIFGRRGLPYDIGIEFVDISRENRERITKWIDSTEESDQSQFVENKKKTYPMKI